jgi:hypothetical protein
MVLFEWVKLFGLERWRERSTAMLWLFLWSRCCRAMARLTSLRQGGQRVCLGMAGREPHLLQARIGRSSWYFLGMVYSISGKVVDMETAVSAIRESDSRSAGGLDSSTAADWIGLYLVSSSAFS